MDKPVFPENKSQRPKKIRYIRELTPDQQRWLVLAVIHILLSDSVLDEKEAVFLNKLSQVFNTEESAEVMREIEKLIEKRELPKLEELRVTDPERLIFMLNTLCSAVFANDKKQDDEVKSYFQAGLKMGMTYEVLMLKLSYQKERFRLKQAQKRVDEEIRQLVAGWTQTKTRR